MKRGFLATLIVLAILFSFQPSSHAAAFLALSDGISASILVEDNLLNDSNPVAGALTFIGEIGGWEVNVTTGLTKPLIGSATDPQMDLNSVNVTSGGAGTLTITLVDLGFTLNGGATLDVGGTLTGVGTVNVYSYYDYGPGQNLIASLGPFGPGAFADTASGNTGSNSPYAMFIVAEIAGTGPITTSFDASLAVPEPGVMLLLGCGLIGLWGFRRRVKK